MNKDIKRDIEKVDFWLGKISLSNDGIIKTTEDLRIILLNLKIVSAYIDKTVGIQPVIDQLEKIVSRGHDDIKELVDTGRVELRESWQEIKKELEGDECNG